MTDPDDPTRDERPALEELLGRQELQALRELEPPASLRPRLLAAAGVRLRARRPRFGQLAAAAVFGFVSFGLLSAAVDRGFAERALTADLPPAEADLFGLAPLLVDEGYFRAIGADSTPGMGEYRMMRRIVHEEEAE